MSWQPSTTYKMPHPSMFRFLQFDHMPDVAAVAEEIESQGWKVFDVLWFESEPDVDGWLAKASVIAEARDNE